MKRVLFILLAVLFAAGLVAAKEAPKAAKKDAPKQEEFRNGPDREQMRKEFKEMKALVEAYKAAKTDKEKAEAQAAVKAKVAANYDRHLEFMQQRVKASQEKLAASTFLPSSSFLTNAASFSLEAFTRFCIN